MSSVDKIIEGLGYDEALAELRSILEALDGEAVDVDKLASQVERADLLIHHCRSRIDAARLQVEQVVEALVEED
ncbi:MAG TPA: exodeoxyribonuclease VII small subunit [Acidimicrobiia bacterium]|jgi:exodeoxyribonuclease VII small subunit|nr:exodeoxyribonuclease VII small subunit [Acidimicrobiia bacterium]HIL47237.1 exodeoxyribonuclease VII small subunit [Acidimicrobiia bacterium]